MLLVNHSKHQSMYSSPCHSKCGPCASNITTPWHSLEMQNLRLYLRVAESETAFEQGPRCYPHTLQLKRHSYPLACLPDRTGPFCPSSSIYSLPAVVTSSSRSLFPPSQALPSSRPAPLWQQPPTELSAVPLLSQLPVSFSPSPPLSGLPLPQALP